MDPELAAKQVLANLDSVKPEWSTYRQILEQNITPATADALSFAKFHGLPCSVELPANFDFLPWRRTREDTPWRLETLICNKQHSKLFVDEWWPIVMPQLLRYMDTTSLAQRADAIRLVKLLAVNHGPRFIQLGILPVFEDSIEACLSFLPPITDPPEVREIHRPAVECLATLAQLHSQLQKNARLNFLAREGCLKPFLHVAQAPPDLIAYFCDTLSKYINTSLQSLTAVQLHSVVVVFNQLLADPFVDFSPTLVAAGTKMMETAIRWAWPRVERYRYEIMYGLAKGKQLNSECAKLLQVTEEERNTIEQAMLQQEEQKVVQKVEQKVEPIEPSLQKERIVELD